jgi:hypothetical protein
MSNLVNSKISPFKSKAQKHLNRMEIEVFRFEYDDEGNKTLDEGELNSQEEEPECFDGIFMAELLDSENQSEYKGSMSSYQSEVDLEAREKNLMDDLKQHLNFNFDEQMDLDPGEIDRHRSTMGNFAGGLGQELQQQYKPEADLSSESS